MAFDDYRLDRVPMTRDDAFACLTLSSDLDAEPLTLESTVRCWRNRLGDQGFIDDVAEGLNKRFSLSLPRSAWRNALTPEQERTLTDVCDLIATHATRPTYHPVTILGSTSASAGAFLAIRELFRQAGADVTDLRPSTPLAPLVQTYGGRVATGIADLSPGLRIPISIYNPVAGGLFLGGWLCCVAFTLLKICGASDVAPYLLGVGLASQVIGFICRYIIPPVVNVTWVRTFRELSELVAGERSSAGPAFEVVH